MKKTSILAVITILFITFFVGCNGDDDTTIRNTERQFGVFKVLSDDTTIEMSGVIGSTTLTNFNSLVLAFPNVKKVNMLDCPGSEDDETNLLVSKRMHDLGIEFHLFNNSVIASGAVDMYVGGVKRTRDAGSQIGVHSWGAGPGEPIATSYPVGHAVHLPYINYYTSVGLIQQEAENFYYFTINAAPADSIHWMTDTEINQYGLITE
jgi:hypothetical protein